ncbi:MAG: hypothetical protein R2825_03350 [Saprospiraceae bacterium]
MFKDGTGKLMGSCTSSRNGKWTFSKKVFTFVDGYGSTFKGEVEWINENYFILTIIDNGSIFERGMKRHFKRAKNGLNSDAPPSYRDANNCKTCKGKGVYTCGNCSGNGYGNFVGQEWHYEYINGEYKNVYGWGVFWKECPICLGTGKITCHH